LAHFRRKPEKGGVSFVALWCILLALPACTKESRVLGPEQPQTPPNGPGDPRARYFEGNAYQVSQGGRYFSWYGCSTCHGNLASGALDLPANLKQRPLPFYKVYAAIAGHVGVPVRYETRIPVEQLWQITAYVRSLPNTKTEMRRRQDLDETGEPQGSSWSGAVR
jgi:mono/diheme cytochrome c family protein